MLKNKDFIHSYDKEQRINVSQVFVKNLKDIKNESELVETYKYSLKKELKKINAVKVEQMNNEITFFYDILKSTVDRKEFYLHEEEYFLLLKKQFKQDIIFLYSYLETEEYELTLKNHITTLKKNISELNIIEKTKKIKGQLINLQTQLNSSIHKLEEFKKLNIKSKKLPLSSICFILYGDEVISFSGGNYGHLIKFGGATALNHFMINFALEKNFGKYNFYGTLETDDYSIGKGNFKFKQQFGGNLIQLVGTFTYTLNPLLKIIEMIRKKKYDYNK